MVWPCTFPRNPWQMWNAQLSLTGNHHHIRQKHFMPNITFFKHLLFLPPFFFLVMSSSFLRLLCAIIGPVANKCGTPASPKPNGLLRPPSPACPQKNQIHSHVFLHPSRPPSEPALGSGTDIQPLRHLYLLKCLLLEAVRPSPIRVVDQCPLHPRPFGCRLRRDNRL